MKRPKLMTVVEFARLGGLASAAKLTPELRRKRAKDAGDAAGLVHAAKKRMRRLAAKAD